MLLKYLSRMLHADCQMLFCVQVWLQEFAWTEASQADKLAERNARAQSKHESTVLSQQPMFCFETAVKLQGDFASADNSVASLPKFLGLKVQGRDLLKAVGSYLCKFAACQYKRSPACMSECQAINFKIWCVI